VSGYGFLRQPRWLSLGFAVLLVVPSFVLLARWQLSRLDERRQTNALVVAHTAAQPVPVGRIVSVGAPASSVGDDQRFLPVTATGHYDLAGQVLVRKRPLDGANGFYVATPLVTSSGATLVVNRGWIAASGGALVAPDVPPPPTGTVTVVGRMQPSEPAPAQPSDLPGGQVTDLDVALASGGSSTVYPGYVDLISSDPAQADGLTPIPLPDLTEGSHLSYALQWLAFAIAAVAGFVLMARRERIEAAADAASADVA
jgi:cytochrome oxidase assembly protein ShyY1